MKDKRYFYFRMTQVERLPHIIWTHQSLNFDSSIKPIFLLMIPFLNF